MSKSRSTRGDYHPWVTFIYAVEEARRRGDRKVGTEHLLLVLLREPSLAQALGTDLMAARAMLEAMDREALSAIIGTALESAPAPIDVPDGPPPRGTLREVIRQRMPMTPVAKTALEDSSRPRRGVRQARSERSLLGRVVDPSELMLALLALEPPDPAAELLTALGIDREQARTRLAARAPAAA